MATEIDPRVARTRATVLAAARDLLIEEGHEGVTIDGVARRAGVARTTIYRHWPDRSQLLSDAFESIGSAIEPPDTGTLRDDLRALLGQLAGALRHECWGQVLPTMIDCGVRNPEMVQHQQRLVRTRRTKTLTVLRRGLARGELPAGTDLELLTDQLVAPLFYRHLVSKMPVTDRYLDALLDATLPATRGPAASPVAARSRPTAGRSTRR